MAIEKMSLVNLVGNIDDLDKTLLKCMKSEYFHPESSIHSAEASNGFVAVEGDNPYSAPLERMVKLASDLHINLKKTEFNIDSLDLDEIKHLDDKLSQSVMELNNRKREIKESINQHEQAIIQIKHLAGLNASFDDIFACQYVKVRFGRLPYDSFVKLNYYDNKTFFFFPFDHDNEYYWGVYFAPATKIVVIDDIFNSLYFERVRVPDYAHGTPEVATSNIKKILKDEYKELDHIRDLLGYIKSEHEEKINEFYCLLKFANSTYNMRKNVASVNDRFYMVGFIPQDKEEASERDLASLESVSCVFKPHDADPTLTPPVKLKNNKFAAPFEDFVKMYSLPSYNDIDPTNLVALTYTILFGIMFGDLGQGLLIAIIGFILSKFKKMNFGKVLTRIGLSSAFFGIVYGSVFGFEDLLNPLYKLLFNMDTKPIHVFDNAMTNILLGGAIAIGALLIVISIVINIVLGFKTKDYERAVFGHNGIAGLILYLSVAVGAVFTMIIGINVFTPIYIICLIVLPLIVIFLREPLAKLVKGNRDFMPHNIGEFIIENFFELFEYVLSYLSNSMSFLRVGGFILSHAGMMAVVMSLAEMVGGGASPIVIVIGNLFVMGLEGLIVGIQVLRLEFYEIFSRNFEGNGKPYEPVSVSYEIDK